MCLPKITMLPDGSTETKLENEQGTTMGTITSPRSVDTILLFQINEKLSRLDKVLDTLYGPELNLENKDGINGAEQEKDR